MKHSQRGHAFTTDGSSCKGIGVQLVMTCGPECLKQIEQFVVSYALPLTAVYGKCSQHRT